MLGLHSQGRGGGGVRPFGLGQVHPDQDHQRTRTLPEGEITVDGIACTTPTDLPKLRSRVGMVFQHFELFPHLSVTENLTIAQIKVLGRSATTPRRAA